MRWWQDSNYYVPRSEIHHPLCFDYSLQSLGDGLNEKILQQLDYQKALKKVFLLWWCSFCLHRAVASLRFFKSRIEFSLLCFASDARILKYFWHENWNNTNSARWSRAAGGLSVGADNASKPIQFWNTSLVHFRTLIKTFALKIRIFIQKSCLSLSETWETLISSTMFQDCLASGLLLRVEDPMKQSDDAARL